MGIKLNVYLVQGANQKVEQKLYIGLHKAALAHRQETIRIDMRTFFSFTMIQYSNGGNLTTYIIHGNCEEVSNTIVGRVAETLRKVH